MTSFIEESAWPESFTNGENRELLEKFYNLSNAPNPGSDASEEALAELFDPEKGVYQLASKKAQGREAIIELRKALFASIPRREHRVVKIFTFGEDQSQLLVLGKVEYGHHHGHETNSDWASKIVLSTSEGQPKLAEVQIIVDTATHI
ncbi:hypothetical protein BD289DRAFT_455767 [Coniella lustricola]|uniref:SnoaL-like domain-containing protein n=1 Tax=Coniella lustricola TaxID=2025994 RepID=A0A2T2ZYF0_9PEZI|nr:hypothetical protein BD289DRAFT_455767 [Coniella lustricola]